ncbi:hypothetical protein EYF80_013550 [Liparis tanakae]|uniref:Uncharacterized protein n=1 Tax=Liparis tanakae TaxID=230148 RepID=A0A4Z2IG36_9TELE|nr:hypothetical protein EYF80_013550 [Liparis tanakae]
MGSAEEILLLSQQPVHRQKTSSSNHNLIPGQNIQVSPRAALKDSNPPVPKTFTSILEDLISAEQIVEVNFTRLLVLRWSRPVIHRLVNVSSQRVHVPLGKTLDIAQEVGVSRAWRVLLGSSGAPPGAQHALAQWRCHRVVNDKP